jgi:hypothetical protein
MLTAQLAKVLRRRITESRCIVSAEKSKPAWKTWQPSVQIAIECFTRWKGSATTLRNSKPSSANVKRGAHEHPPRSNPENQTLEKKQMNPNDMQNLVNMQQQALQRAEFQMYFLGYSTYVAIIICAIFSILIFWKLRDIADELRQFRIAFEMADDRKAQSAAPTPRRADDDSRYTPKS